MPQHNSERRLASGNEAVAQAALDAGVSLGTGYPGTPSTEILEAFDAIGGRAQWAPNEKVALEVGIGAAFAGARALVTMKHVGLNVAADPLFTVAYTGVTGGLVIVSADDPGMASSQNEQDNRRFRRGRRPTHVGAG
jgi:indolepyruvate ferredoxin oxidoreductase alpha subunit